MRIFQGLQPALEFPQCYGITNKTDYIKKLPYMPQNVSNMVFENHYLKAMKFKHRYMHFFSFDLPAIICNVICDLGREGAFSHFCNWIRFNRQSNQLSPIKSPIIGHANGFFVA